MDDSEQNKSEQATSYKLQQARRKGSVARGMDLGFLTSVAAFIGYAWVAGPAFGEQIALAVRRSLVAAPQVLGSSNAILTVTGTILSTAMRPLAFMAATIFAAVLVMELVQTGVVFSTEPLKLNFTRLNPAQNLKRLFSVRLLIETAKNILKLAVYGFIAFSVIRHARAEVATITGGQALAYAMARTGLKLLLFFAAAAVLFAAFDQFVVRRDFAKKMRMSRRELRREVRDREGEPRMKQRRKQLHAEFAKLSQSLRNIKGADVLVTNPTHYAVALKYDGRSMTAPTVVSKGAHQMAQRLKRLAFLYGVVIVQDRELARALYFKSQINSEIPEPFYRRVADIYLKMREAADNTQGVTVNV